MPKIIYSPIPAQNIRNLSSMTGGQVFCFYEQGMDILDAINSGAVFMAIKESHKEGTVKVVNLQDGLILSRDNDRKVVQLDAEFQISLVGAVQAPVFQN